MFVILTAVKKQLLTITGIISDHIIFMEWWSLGFPMYKNKSTFKDTFTYIFLFYFNYFYWFPYMIVLAKTSQTMLIGVVRESILTLFMVLGAKF